MLLLQTLLTEKQVEYDRMLGSCNHLSGRELELRKFQMREKEKEIQDLRQQVALKVQTYVK